MATPVIDQLSKDLAFKIFDPVGAGGDDGKIFSKELRLGYLNRAYGSLVGLIEAFEVDKTKVFKDYYTVLNGGDIVSAVSNGGYALSAAYDVFDVYYSKTNGGTQLRAERLEPENFLAVKNGINSHYTASADERYWSLIDGVVKLLPTPSATMTYYDLTIFARGSFPDFIQRSTTTGVAWENLGTQGANGDAGDYTIVLGASASSTDDIYNYCTLDILVGGVMQTVKITDYVGSTKVATIDAPLTVEVDGGTYTVRDLVDMSIPGDYKSILITLAAIEAMADKGDVSKFQLYSNTLGQQLQIMGLKARKQQEMAEEGKK